jgi:hypothetical protein
MLSKAQAFYHRYNQRCVEITHDPLLFSVAPGIFLLCPERLSRSTLHFIEGGEGSLYSCTLWSCNCDVLHRPIGEDSDKIPVGRTSTYCLLGYPDVLKVLISDAGGGDFAMKEREASN